MSSLPPDITERIRNLAREVDGLRREIEPPSKWPARLAGVVVVFALCGVGWVAIHFEVPPVIAHLDGGVTDGPRTMIAVESAVYANAVAGGGECIERDFDGRCTDWQPLAMAEGKKPKDEPPPEPRPPRKGNKDQKAER